MKFFGDKKGKRVRFAEDYFVHEFDDTSKQDDPETSSSSSHENPAGKAHDGQDPGDGGRMGEKQQYVKSALKKGFRTLKSIHSLGSFPRSKKQRHEEEYESSLRSEMSSQRQENQRGELLQPKPEDRKKVGKGRRKGFGSVKSIKSLSLGRLPRQKGDEEDGTDSDSESFAQKEENENAEKDTQIPEADEEEKKPKIQQNGRPEARKDKAEERIGFEQSETSIFVWSFVIGCIIFAVLLIICGLMVLIGYLAFHPHTPSFRVENGALMSLLLDQNLFLTSLFTIYVTSHNPNDKVTVVYKNIKFEMQYEGHAIARQFQRPFIQHAGNKTVPLLLSLASNSEPLQVSEGLQLSLGIQRGIVAFDLVATAKTKMKFSTLASVKFTLHTRCNLLFSPPAPLGNYSLVASHCRSWK